MAAARVRTRTFVQNNNFDILAFDSLFNISMFCFSAFRNDFENSEIRIENQNNYIDCLKMRSNDIIVKRLHGYWGPHGYVSIAPQVEALHRSPEEGWSTWRRGCAVGGTTDEREAAVCRG